MRSSSVPLVGRALLCLVLAATGVLAWAGPGHDHGDENGVPINANGPQRLPDGTVFLPKPSQRQLAVRTIVVEPATVPQTVVLNGRVVMDPNAGGRVQPTVAGRIEPAPRGFPSLGQRVRKGEVLAYVRPSAGQIERANQTAQFAELTANRDVAVKRLARLEQLAGSVPQREIEAARAEADALRQRVAAVGGSLRDSEPLVAPVDGVIAAANVVSGQVVDAREVAFEIVDPARLRVEAVTFDFSLPNEVAGAALDLGPQSRTPLEFVGAGRTLRELALPLLFRTTPQAVAPLAVGQPVKVIVQTTRRVDGVPVPAAALARNPANETIVWVHTAAELFVPRTVRFTELDGSTVSVLSGLQGGERVVVEGASLVNQVR
jgi:hypothetical protein